MLFRIQRITNVSRKVVNHRILKETVVRSFATTFNRMSKPKVLVTRGDIPETALNILAEKYFSINESVLAFYSFTLVDSDVI